MAVRILDEHLINKIAAGEVVERPASVLKELFENALDAGATDVRVHLRAGGRNLVKVIDNGSGMNRTDAVMCTERHATSKIRTDDDLFRVSTLGFRGEAIPSIASVSRFTLLTRPNPDCPAWISSGPGPGTDAGPGTDEDIGTCVELNGGKLIDVRAAGCAPGTEIAVADLFFNVPARRKFLRTIETELGHCVEAVTRSALTRPDLDLEVLHEDRTVLRCAPTADHRRRAADLLGPHGEALIPVTFSRGTLEVRALLSPVGVHRAQSTGSTWTYVNGRFVRDLMLRRALSAAYAGIVPKDRYPLVILDIRIPPADVDVNVHPAKTEVRFAHGFELQNALTQGLRTALQDYGIQRPVTAARPVSYGAPLTPNPTQVRLPVAFPETQAPPSQACSVSVSAEPTVAWKATAPPQPSVQVPSARTAPTIAAPIISPIVAPIVAPLVAPIAAPIVAPAPVPAPPSAPASLPASSASSPNRPLLPVARFQDLRVIGQLQHTYLLCEGNGELVIIDQHAAAERVTLYKLSCDRENVVGGAQQLLTPRLIRLGAQRARALAPQVDSLLEWGLDVRFLGGDTFAVHGLPAPLARADLDALLGDIADELANGAPASMAQEKLDHFLNTLACHTSIRAGDVLSTEQIQRILRDLDEVDFSVCAHGRPVLIGIPPAELERRFHR
jgi:DNA mismatch repair protein MutL